MEIGLFLALVTLALAYAFDFANGFHDTANAVTTIIYTKAMKARNAIVMSGMLNFLGAVIVGTAVAMVITKIIPEDKVSTELVLAALVGGLIWNVGTWYHGLRIGAHFFEPVGAPISAKAQRAYPLQRSQLKLPHRACGSPVPSVSF
jgi:phosphate/sulfate permease